jgi:hypothetical protein
MAHSPVSCFEKTCGSPKPHFREREGMLVSRRPGGSTRSVAHGRVPQSAAFYHVLNLPFQLSEVIKWDF